MRDKKKGQLDTTKDEGREQTDKNIGAENPELEKRYQEVIQKIKEKTPTQKTAAQARSETVEAQAKNDNAEAENAETELGEVEGALTEIMEKDCVDATGETGETTWARERRIPA